MFTKYEVDEIKLIESLMNLDLSYGDFCGFGEGVD
jgi:hypothetical protein